MSAFPDRRSRAHVVLLLALALAACRAQVPPPFVPYLGSLTAEAALATVQAREQSVQTLRAQFAATAVQDQETRHADGVLLLKRPDRVRLRLVSTFGLTVLDYTRVGGRTQLLLPLEDRTIDDPAGATAASGPADFGRLLLHLGDDPVAPCTAHNDGKLIVVECVGPEGALVRRATIDPATATVTEEVAFADGEPQVTMALSDYRVVDGVPLPFHIRLTHPRTGASTEIRVRSYAVNPDLEDRLFAMRGVNP